MRSHAILEVWFLLNIGALHTAGALFFLNPGIQLVDGLMVLNPQSDQR